MTIDNSETKSNLKDKETQETDTISSSDPVGKFIAAAVLVFFAILVGYMLYIVNFKDGLTDLNWARSLYIFSGIEAVAFAAAGYLFGREVNRRRAETAEEKADEEGKIADQAIADATEAQSNGRSLVSMIELKKQKLQAVSQKSSKASAETFKSSDSDMDELLRMGEELFPKAAR